MVIDFHIVWASFISGIHYIPQTLLLVFAPYAISFVFGLLIALARFLHIPVLSPVLTAVVTVLKGIPVYLLIVISNLLLTLGFDSFAESVGWSLRVGDINILAFAVIVLSIGFTPYLSEALRGALNSVPKGQYEAGYAIGLTKAQIIRRVVIPQMIPTAMPQMTSLIIALMKASALTYTIGVMDILNASIKPAIQGYDLLEAYIAAGVIYWALGVILERGMHLAEARLKKFRAPIAS